jgi:hypothetical protein
MRGKDEARRVRLASNPTERRAAPSKSMPVPDSLAPSDHEYVQYFRLPADGPRQLAA